MSTCTTIYSNPDVSGIGIRVNLYISMLLIAMIPKTARTTPLLDVVVTNAGISGFALLVTAMVQTSKDTLTLYHAIFIVHILYFKEVIVEPNPTENYKENTQTHIRRRVASFITGFGRIFLFNGFAFYIWAKAPTFGQNVECSDQIKYIFFFVSVRATVGWLRMLLMAYLGITLSIATIIGIPLMPSLCWIYFKFLGSGSSAVDESSSRHPRRGGIGLWIRVFKSLTLIYGVVMLELYEKRNEHLLTPGENNFTFGQIMALVQIVGVLTEVFHLILGGCTVMEEKEDEPNGSHPQQPNSDGSSEIQNVATTGTTNNEPIYSA